MRAWAGCPASWVGTSQDWGALVVLLEDINVGNFLAWETGRKWGKPQNSSRECSRRCSPKSGCSGGCSRWCSSCCFPSSKPPSAPSQYTPEHPDFGEHPREHTRELFWDSPHVRPVSQDRKFPTLMYKTLAQFLLPMSGFWSKMSLQKIVDFVCLCVCVFLVDLSKENWLRKNSLNKCTLKSTT